MRYKIDWNGMDMMQIQSTGLAQQLLKKDKTAIHFVI
jgi:hypothetical protein